MHLNSLRGRQKRKVLAPPPASPWAVRGRTVLAPSKGIKSRETVKAAEKGEEAVVDSRAVCARKAKVWEGSGQL